MDVEGFEGCRRRRVSEGDKGNVEAPDMSSARLPSADFSGRKSLGISVDRFDLLQHRPRLLASQTDPGVPCSQHETFALA